MQEIIAHLEKRGVEYKNFGITECKSVDYPDIALPVAQSVAKGECEKGLLVCGTGIGMSMAANKVKGIRAACCSDHFSVKFTRLHNDANILCLGGRVIGPGVAGEMWTFSLTPSTRAAVMPIVWPKSVRLKKESCKSASIQYNLS